MRSVLPMMVLVLFATGEVVNAADWQMLPQTSRLSFTTQYEGTEAPGVFKQFQAILNFDPRTPRKGRIDIQVKTASADMESAEINEAVIGPDWLDSINYPRAQFRSSHIVANGIVLGDN